ncbi:helix-turn-helix transcriptional regulator [Kocuria sp. CPCC 205292]|uniref:helix-turn-helix transcriptional regulator n=1 Tax=Kocuria cellulosilytica TaxID=3071451 RepID=UPI0034D71319
MSEAFHLELAAEDPDAVMLLFETIGARFSFQPSERGLSYREERTGDEDVSLARVEVEGSYSSWGDTEMFSVVQRTAGRCDWSTRTESGTGIGAPVLITPSSPTLFVVDSLRASNVYLTAGMVQDIAETVYGTENTPVAFASAHPLTPQLGQYWSSLTRLAQELVDSGAFDAPLVRAGLTRHLAVALLECFPLVGDQELRALSMAAQTRRYRIAKQFIDDHAHQPITVDDAARAANTPTSTLAQAFRANHPHRLSPTEYLAQARLAGAHAELLHADPTTGETVAGIAARWGFAHSGRFASRYRATYGVPPSTTLYR